MLTAEEIKSITLSGEGYNVEFKLKVPSKVRELSAEVCAFANSEGGYLIIGVDDNGQIVGVEIDNPKRSAIQDISPAIHTAIYSVTVDDKSIWIIDVPSGKDKPYVLSGAIYVRESANTQKLTTAEEMRSFFQQSNRIYFDTVPCPKFNINTQFNKDNFIDFCIESQLSTTTSDKQILENLQVFDDTGVIKSGGVLFFGKHPEEMFHQAVVRCVLFKGKTKVHIIDDKTFGGPLYRQYLQAMSWIESKLQIAYIIEGRGPRKEVWEIPLTVFKEAIINALSHRDYYEQGATTNIEMFDDRVEVSNPGGLLLGVVKDFGKKSMSRNPLIFGLFTRMHLVERVASGVPRMREAMKAANLSEPIFRTEGMFTVVFERPEKRIEENGTVNGIVNTEDDIVNDIVNGTKEDVLNIMKQQEGLSASELAQKINKSLRTTMRYIDTLKRAGLIEFRGAPKTGGYYLIK